MIELTEQQREAVARAVGEPPTVIDPVTQMRYVLLRAEVYDRLKGLLAEDPQPADAYPAIDRAFAEGWADPKMDDYDRYEELKR